MLPLLRLAQDEREHTMSESIERLAQEFRLSEAEKNELLPSGRQSKFSNRVGWACTYLKKARFLESTGRARFRITPRGLEILASNLQRIDNSVLEQYPEFVEFRSISEREDSEELPTAPQIETTPEELLESSYQALRKNLSQELLEQVKNCSPKFFENLVVDLLVAMGYGGSRRDAGKAVGRSGDGGIDGMIKEDKLGLDVVYIQAKRWENTVGAQTVREFAGSLEGYRARKGVLITTSQFSADAVEYAKHIEKKIVLVDGAQLAQLMIEHGIGVTEVSNYQIKKIDTDYFEGQE